MDKINAVLVAFSATSIRKKLAKAALDLAEENDAKLIILSVRDRNVAQMVAKVTKDHGFLGKDFVEKLAEDIKKDRDELITSRLGMIENEAEKRGIEFETVKMKGHFVESVADIAEIHKVDLVVTENVDNIAMKLKRKGISNIRII
ncbi:universal stress protein [Methanococcoides orientis]|uniref:universal stress protein n=1 Tax=Methanococcoides orientis TaxID=2822137 RepID=UPI001E35E35C|nr:universal stress protein [Methanococcoides orientis]UGV40308.1 universal stress protein [Methanococcoides orientis]